LLPTPPRSTLLPYTTLFRSVVHDQDPTHAPPVGIAGKNSLNAAPPSRAESTQTTPPMSCTARATTARPRPVPFPGGLVVKKGSRSEEHTSELQSLRHLVCRL